jgi:hypothetical protein
MTDTYQPLGETLARIGETLEKCAAAPLRERERSNPRPVFADAWVSIELPLLSKIVEQHAHVHGPSTYLKTQARGA